MEPESYPHVLSILFLYTVGVGLFGWVPPAVGDWWRGRRTRR